MADCHSPPHPGGVSRRMSANDPQYALNRPFSGLFSRKKGTKATFLAVIGAFLRVSGLFLRLFGLFLLGIFSLTSLINDKNGG